MPIDSGAGHPDADGSDFGPHLVEGVSDSVAVGDVDFGRDAARRAAS